MSIQYYRQIWATDMENRTVDTPLNTLTPKQWLEEWKQMIVPGAYERGIFGDLMLPGIACGVSKILLIFNTHPDTPHDPIYIVDPSEFNVRPDSEIPIVLAYNMSHYESLEPLEESDIKTTVDLVHEYKSGTYRYHRRDMLKLIDLKLEKETCEHIEIDIPQAKKMKIVTDNEVGKRCKDVTIPNQKTFGEQFHHEEKSINEPVPNQELKRNTS